MNAIQEVVAGNQALLRRARELNKRAGRDMFPIPAGESLAGMLRQVLGGAARMADIADPSTLHLPSLDETRVMEVIRLCPDTIMVCGREVAVEYRGSGYMPLVRIDFQGEQAKDWLRIPEGGTQLPDGREVKFYSVVEGYGYYLEVESSKFKAKARERLNQKIWESWPKPAISLPDFTGEAAAIPEIATVEYGMCVVTGEPLVAYGVVTVNSNRYYSSDPYFKTEWLQDQSEAERKLGEAQVKLESVRAELRTKAELEAAKSAAEAVRTRVSGLYSSHYYNYDTAEELRSRLYNRRYNSLPSSVAELRTWAAETETLCVEVEVAVATIAERKAEAERQQREAEARREVVETAIADLFEGHYADAHIWVPENGEAAYILAGKASKMGDFVVLPTAGEHCYDGPWCFGDPKYRHWVPFQFGVKSKAQDFSRSGNVQSEVKLFLPEGVLKPGVYGVAQDSEGQFFFPVIHHNADGIEVVPEVVEIKKIRMPKKPPTTAKGTAAPASDDKLAALAAKFGCR